ncbi:hypothetical protein BDP55DRAFT_80473 [Colletotrichum godetiae]|uniref:Fork-head domain-containing protein n=1 Tax=Colletotrichum godetiae TaxID=1209918 RepID=A0AAJ0A527_9PEZI|nr:uncharacterized protein BDP55DRAFT_80473 [Colletotrichum godetiae]KAK1656646.1 hypothetical protein BDP55DRAFT_80473 [Colletotrichum godetiae]
MARPSSSSKQRDPMDPVRASPIPSECQSPPLPRPPHHRTSHEDVSTRQLLQPQFVPAQHGAPHQPFSVDLAFPRLPGTAIEPSATANTWLDEGEQKMTFAQLIYIALHSKETKAMGLGELYHWFEQNTWRANKGGEGWKNSVRSNLSVNKVR